MNNFIFDYYKKDTLIDMLTCFQFSTGLQAQMVDIDGNVLISTKKPVAFCTEIKKYLPEGDTCKRQHKRAGLHAKELGESYLFTCHAGLYHIIYPLIIKDTMLGSIIVGPFLMDTPDSSLVLDIKNKYKVNTEGLLKLMDDAHEIKIISPELADQYMRLLYYIMSGLNSGSQELLMSNQERLLQQSRINEAIQIYKSNVSAKTDEYPLDKEALLVTKVKTGDTESAKAILNDMLGYLMLYEKHEIENLKIRIIELCVLLSRAAIERGAASNIVLELNNKLVTSIMASNDIYDICYTFQDNIDIFTDTLFFASEKNSGLIKRATEYIAAHYSENITLQDVALNTHLNSSYLSTLFKHITGLSFKEYLNTVRVEEAKRLLANTDYPIIDIAIACGFNDQSYFTKVFKKYTGITPKNFR